MSNKTELSDFSDIHIYEPIAIFRILKTKTRGDVWQQQWADKYGRKTKWKDVDIVIEEDDVTQLPNAMGKENMK